MSNNNSGNSFFAFLSGAAVGALVGILYAPDKGSNTRDRLAYKLEQYKDQLQDLIDELIEGKEEVSSEAREKYKQVNQDTINKAEQIMNDINALQQTIRGTQVQDEE